MQTPKHVFKWFVGLYVLGLLAFPFSVQAQRVDLDQLMTTYIDLTFQSFAQGMDQVGGQAQSLPALQSNAADMANSISEIYDDEIGGGFEVIWNRRVNFFSDYLNAFKAGDENELLLVRESIDNSVIEVAAYLEEVVTDFSGASAQAQLFSISSLFYEALEKYQAGDVEAFNTLEEESVRQVNVLSTSLEERVAADLILITKAQEEAARLAAEEEAARIAAEEEAARIAAEEEAARLAAEEEANRLEEEQAAAEAAAAQESEAASQTNTATSTTSTTDSTTAVVASTDATTGENTTTKTATIDLVTTVDPESEQSQTTTEENETRELVRYTVDTPIYVRNPDTQELEPYPFSDVNATHDFRSILDINRRGIVQGYDDGTYRPENPVNRAEFTKIIVGTVESNPRGFDCFPDVRQEWFAAFVCFAQANGIVGGYPDGTFKPANQVNFAEAYKILGETLFPGEAVATEVWYQGYVDLAVNRGYVLDLSIPFDTSITREQLATMVARAMASKEQ